MPHPSRSPSQVARFAVRLGVTMLLLTSCGPETTTPQPPGGDDTEQPPPPPPPPPPADGPLSIAIITATSQTVPANENPTSAMGVKVTDSTGAPLKGIALTWTVTSGGGTLVNPPAATDSLGRAVALWRLGPYAAPQTLTVSHARAATPATFTGYVPLGTVTANAGAGLHYVGDTLSSYMTVKDSKGTLLSGARVVVRDTTVARDVGESSDSLVGTGDGWTYVVVVTGPLNTPKDSVRVDFYRELHGAVYTYDDSPLPGLRAYSTNGDVTDSADVAPDGTYRIPLTNHATGWVTEVLIDAVGADRADRKFFPALMPVANSCKVKDLPNCVGTDASSDVSFVLVPREYEVPLGMYAGQTLDVDPNAAMVTSTNTGPSYWQVSGAYQAPLTSAAPAPTLQNLYAASEQAWLTDSLPIGVAMHRACCSTREIVADDSVQLMRALSIIETAVGLDIWHPMNGSDAFHTDRADSRTPNRVLLFQFDSVLPPAVTGGASTGAIGADVGSPQILTLNDFVVSGWRGSATDHIQVSNTMSQSQVIAYNPDYAGQLGLNVLVHEAMHTLGMGHGCQWNSSQSYCGMTVDSFPSFEDVAYLHLAMAVKSATWKHRAQHSLTAALFGQRAVMLGEDPIPAPWTIAEPAGVSGPDSNVRSAGVLRRKR